MSFTSQMIFPHVDSLTNAPSSVHDSASLQFLSRQVAPSRTHYDNSNYNARTAHAQFTRPPRFASNTDQPPSRYHDPLATQRPHRPVPPALLDDPAFSADPHVNPEYFAITSRRQQGQPPRANRDHLYGPNVPQTFSDNNPSNLAWQPPHAHAPYAASAVDSRPPTIARAPSNHARTKSSLAPIPPRFLNQNAPSAPLPRPDVPVVSASRQPVFASSGYSYPGMWRPPTHSMYSDSESSSGSPISLPRSLPPSSVSSSASLSISSHSSHDVIPSLRTESVSPAKTPPSASTAVIPQDVQNTSEPPPYTDLDDPLPGSMLIARPKDMNISEPVEEQVLVPFGPTLVPEEFVTFAPVAKQVPTSAPSAPGPVQSSVFDRPPLTSRNITAPTLHTQPIVKPLTRAATAPIPAAQPVQTHSQHHVLHRKRSRKPSTTVTPPELPRIEEADELASQDPLDPLGFAWRLAGPYEVAGPGVSRSKSSTKLNVTGEHHGENENKAGLGTQAGKNTREGPAAQATRRRMESSSRKPAQTSGANQTTFSVEPGQIFPSMVSYQPQPDFDPYAQLASSASATYSPNNLSHSSSYIRNPAPSADTQIPSPQELPTLPKPGPNTTNMAAEPPEAFVDTTARPSHTRPVLTDDRYVQPTQQPADFVSQGYTQSEVRSETVSRTRAQSLSRHDTRVPSDVVPRPDIVLPPHGSAPSIHSTSTSSHYRQPHYLPKKLVMPAPLQQQTPVNPPMNMGGTPARPAYPRGHMNNDSQSGKKVRFHNEAATRSVRAQEIPISQGPNVLRKRSTTFGSSYNTASFENPAPMPPSASAPAPNPSVTRRSTMHVENAPSSSTSAAMFSARVDVVQRAPTMPSQRMPQTHPQPPSVPMKQDTLWVPRDRTREREIERTFGIADVSMAPVDGKEKRGKKLSKRR